MGIQKCENCGYQFTWKEVEQSFVRWTAIPLVCKKCGTSHEISKRTRFLVALPVPIMIGILNVRNLYLGLPITLILFAAVILSYPYFARYKATR